MQTALAPKGSVRRGPARLPLPNRAPRAAATISITMVRSRPLTLNAVDTRTATRIPPRKGALGTKVHSMSDSDGPGFKSLPDD